MEPRKKKPIFKRVWFWVVVVLIAYALISPDSAEESEEKEHVSSSDENVNERLKVLRKKANRDRCNVTVLEDEEGSTSVEDDQYYFDEVVLNAWYNSKGKPIAETLPKGLSFCINMHGGNTSNLIKDFRFINNEKNTLKMLKKEGASEKAVYALILKNIYILDNEELYGETGILGWDYMTDSPVIVKGDALQMDDGDTVLVFGEYISHMKNETPVFENISSENITHLFSQEELKQDMKNLKIPTREALDLGTLGTDSTIEDFLELSSDNRTIFKGKFVEADPLEGASLLYTEQDSNNEVTYLFFVDTEEKNYKYNNSKYGYIEEELVWYANGLRLDKVTEQVINQYVEESFGDEVVEEISCRISEVDKIDENYYICYMTKVSRKSVYQGNIFDNIDAECVGIDDTVKFNDDLKFTITDAGFWNDKEHGTGTNVFIDIELTGKALADYRWLVKSIIADMQFWSDGILLAKNPKVQVDGRDYSDSFGYDYSLDYQGNPVSLRIYASCSRLDYDRASKIIAELNGTKELAILIKNKGSK